MKHDIKPRDIMTRAAFENAMVIVMALGGSTNAVLHLIAMARACGVPLSLDDFQAASDRTPFIADLKPSGKYVMEDVHKVRNEPALLLSACQAMLPVHTLEVKTSSSAIGSQWRARPGWHSQKEALL